MTRSFTTFTKISPIFLILIHHKASVYYLSIIMPESEKNLFLYFMRTPSCIKNQKIYIKIFLKFFHNVSIHYFLKLNSRSSFSIE